MADGGSGGGGRSYNMRNPAVKRIMQEIKEMQKEKCTDYLSMPLEEDIFEWQFAVHGPRDSEFEGGIYHGRITLPADYPFKPPSFMLLTPSGRFEVQTKICLSISNHHPEHWQPSWSVRTALVALIAFMPTKPDGALGSLDFPKEERRALAVKSRLAPPQFGSPERQRLMQQIHEQMLKTAPPVPTKPLPVESASSPPPKPAPSPAASPASPPPSATPSASSQATADAASAASLPLPAVADSVAATASEAGLNAPVSPASSHMPAAIAAVLPAVAMGCAPHSSSTTSVPGLESASSQETVVQSQGETVESTPDGSSTTPSAAPLGSTRTPILMSSGSSAVSPAHMEVTAEQGAAAHPAPAVQQGQVPVTDVRQRVAAGAAGTGGAVGAHRAAPQDVVRVPLQARGQLSSSTDRLLSLLAAVIGLAIAVIMWQKMSRIFAGSYLAGSDSEL